MSALANRYGFRLVAILGSVISCSAFVLSYFSTSIEFLYISYGVLGKFLSYVQGRASNSVLKCCVLAVGSCECCSNFNVGQICTISRHLHTLRRTFVFGNTYVTPWKLREHSATFFRIYHPVYACSAPSFYRLDRKVSLLSWCSILHAKNVPLSRHVNDVTFHSSRSRDRNFLNKKRQDRQKGGTGAPKTNVNFHTEIIATGEFVKIPFAR